MLYVSSDAVDTDFHVRLTDVYPSVNGTDGESRLLQDNAFRMRWRLYDTPKNITPGEVYEISLTLWNTSYVFDAGHSLRVVLRAKDFADLCHNISV